MRIAIIKYNGGNVRSVAFALERLGIDYAVTDEAEQIQKADKVIFPGVGEAGTTMHYLKSKQLDVVIKNLKQPVLGICLGMQLMCRYSREGGGTECLGIFNEDVQQFIPTINRKVPHVGWNQLRATNGWLASSYENEHVYFVHSFYVPVNKYSSANADYGISFSAAMRKDNFYAVQFHPEKSANTGSLILNTFLSI
jgi:glutamine amidotransferase